MSYYTNAVARARTLRESILDHGGSAIRGVSIELQQGRPGTPNDRWYDTRQEAEMSHHTVSRPSQGDTPCLALVKRGRSDVPGPLCNGYMGYDRIYRIICMGWANHPGAGGPLTVAGFRIPKDNARPYAWGTEYEGGLESWSGVMHEAMARANAGILDWLNEPLEAHIEHKTWAPTRKIDRLGYTASSGRTRIKPYMGTTAPTPEPQPTEDYMSDPAAFLKVLQDPRVRQELANIDAEGFRDGTTTRREIKELVWEVLNRPIAIGGATKAVVNDGRPADQQLDSVPLYYLLRYAAAGWAEGREISRNAYYAHHHASRANERAARIETAVAAVEATLAADAEADTEAIVDAVRQAIESIDVTLNVAPPPVPDAAAAVDAGDASA